MANAGTSVDGGDEEQEGQHGTFLEAGLGLAELNSILGLYPTLSAIPQPCSMSHIPEIGVGSIA